MLQIGLILLGIFAAAFGTIVGAGGGFLVVPVLLTLFTISPEVAASTGLAIVCINAVSGLPVLFKQKRILKRSGFLLAIGAIPGTFLGDLFVTYSPEQVFYSLFACLLIGLGVFLMVKKPKKSKASVQMASTEDPELIQHAEDHLGSVWKLLLIGLLLGVVSSFFGIGGGWLLVPILVYGLGISMKAATATSMLSLAIYSFVGVLPSVFDGMIEWQMVFWTGIGVIAGAQIGAIVSKRMKGSTISRLLASLVVILGINMFFQI